MKFNLYISAIIAVVLCSCGGRSADNEVAAAADSFAVNYFNCQYHKALPFVTDSSQKWLLYAASQMKQEDVDTLRARTEGARTEVGEPMMDDNGSAAVVPVSVCGFYQADTIGRAGTFIDEAIFRIRMVKECGRWKALLTSLPQRE